MTRARRSRLRATCIALASRSTPQRGRAPSLQARGCPWRRLPRAARPTANTRRWTRSRDGKFALIINTPLGKSSREDGVRIRALATRMEVPLITTLSAAQAAVNGIQALRQKELSVRSLQEHYTALG